MNVDWFAVAKKMAEAARVKVAEDRRQLRDLLDRRAMRKIDQVSFSSQ
jgi:hypothetical protein